MDYIAPPKPSVESVRLVCASMEKPYEMPFVDIGTPKPSVKPAKSIYSSDSIHDSRGALETSTKCSLWVSGAPKPSRKPLEPAHTRDSFNHE